MTVTEKNCGIYVPFTLDGTKLDFRSGALTLDLRSFERDYPVHLDVSADSDGALVLGPAFRYVAELDIPARGYELTAGAADDFGFPKLYKTAKPFDPDKVTLTLWALEV
jgi:hypothetical protein